MPIPLSQRPWLVRFAWLGVVILFLRMPFVTYALWCHMSGMDELDRVLKRHAQEGRGSTIQDLLADIPDSDADRHERWWRWQGTVASHEHHIQKFNEAWESDDARKWKLGLSVNPPASLTDAFSKVEGLVTEVESLLDAGPFIAGMAGHFKSTIRLQDSAWLLRAYYQFSTTAIVRNEQDALLHLLDVHAVRFATSALEYRALSSDSPASHAHALQRMDKLIDVCSHPLGLGETMGLLVAIARNDDAHLAAVLRRSLPEEAFTAWLADDRSSRSLRQVATGFRAGRLMQTGCLIPLIHDGGLHRFEYNDRRPITRLEGWMNGPAGLALSSDAMADTERRIERGPKYALDLDPLMRAAKWNLVAKVLTGNLIEAGITAAELQLAARRTRIIALIVRHAMTSSLPADMTELQTLLGTRSSWLDAADDQCAMSYTRLANDRFRLGIDLARSTHGDFTPLDRYQSMAKSTPSPSTRGTPTPPRTDLPPLAKYRIVDVEIWIPAPR